ncbi:MAG: M48 family metalloprotease [Actinomycetota bacterium]|nr:M48 family metalloprotease [Actinomycetota bacterium]
MPAAPDRPSRNQLPPQPGPRRLRALSGSTSASPSIDAIVASLAERAHRPAVAVVVCPAKTFGLSSTGGRFRWRRGVGRIELGCETPAEPEERLAVILAHELGHARHTPLLRRASLVAAPALVFTATFAGLGALGHGLRGAVAGLLSAGFLATMAVLVCMAALSRRDERDADRFAAFILGHEAVTSWLATLPSTPAPPWAPRWLSQVVDVLFATHPDPEARIRAVERRRQALKWP